MHLEHFYTLNASCPDQMGLVARISDFFTKRQGWILETAFHAEPATAGDTHSQGRYFMRIEVKAQSLNMSLSALKEQFTPLAKELNMQWYINDSAIKKRVILLVSKQEHCLYDLLARWRSKELNIEIACVISNHTDFADFVRWHGIDFHHVPVNETHKTEAFAQIQRLFETYQGDVMVLARYMQILPEQLCQQYTGRIINIHHSFLPSFVGAKPYHQAYSRGVKLIGATCHYVTSELDQGPIIEQDVIRIDHSDTPEDLVRYGKDIEKAVLARGLRYHIEDRVLIYGNKTIVFR